MENRLLEEILTGIHEMKIQFTSVDNKVDQYQRVMDQRFTQISEEMKGLDNKILEFQRSTEQRFYQTTEEVLTGIDEVQSEFIGIDKKMNEYQLETDLRFRQIIQEISLAKDAFREIHFTVLQGFTDTTKLVAATKEIHRVVDEHQASLEDLGDKTRLQESSTFQIRRELSELKRRISQLEERLVLTEL